MQPTGQEMGEEEERNLQEHLETSMNLLVQCKGLPVPVLFCRPTVYNVADIGYNSFWFFGPMRLSAALHSEIHNYSPKLLHLIALTGSFLQGRRSLSHVTIKLLPQTDI